MKASDFLVSWSSVRVRRSLFVGNFGFGGWSSSDGRLGSVSSWGSISGELWLSIGELWLNRVDSSVLSVGWSSIGSLSISWGSSEVSVESVGYWGIGWGSSVSWGSGIGWSSGISWGGGISWSSSISWGSGKMSVGSIGWSGSIGWGSMNVSVGSIGYWGSSDSDSGRVGRSGIGDWSINSNSGVGVRGVLGVVLDWSDSWGTDGRLAVSLDVSDRDGGFGVGLGGGGLGDNWGDGLGHSDSLDIADGSS
jgi:hypothetical protein